MCKDGACGHVTDEAETTGDPSRLLAVVGAMRMKIFKSEVESAFFDAADVLGVSEEAAIDMLISFTGTLIGAKVHAYKQLKERGETTMSDPDTVYDNALLALKESFDKQLAYTNTIKDRSSNRQPLRTSAQPDGNEIENVVREMMMTIFGEGEFTILGAGRDEKTA